MSYTYINSNNVVPQYSTPIGLGITYRDPFKIVYDPVVQARVNLKTLLLTRKGERVMAPEFGTDLINLVFEPLTDVTKQLIATTIDDAVGKYLPYLELQNITIVGAEDMPGADYSMHITLLYTVDNIDQTLELLF